MPNPPIKVFYTPPDGDTIELPADTSIAGVGTRLQSVPRVGKKEFDNNLPIYEQRAMPRYLLFWLHEDSNGEVLERGTTRNNLVDALLFVGDMMQHYMILDTHACKWVDIEATAKEYAPHLLSDE